MDTIVLFDPAIRSFNKGDEIIMRSAERELTEYGILKDSFVIHCATHAPAVTWYQNTSRNTRLRIYDGAKYKFICGSNLLWKNMFKPLPSLNVNLFNSRPYKNAILMGVGTGQARDTVNLYTKKLYSQILSKDFIHSTRDTKTAEFLQNLGYNALDTGCPTMWKFTPEFCQMIPKNKAESVLLTLTDYGADREYDQKLIDILRCCYENVYFWIQGASDWDYFCSLKNIDGIHIISPSVEEYDRILSEVDIDYVGTRLHAGMFALQHRKRTIILAVDNRVRDMQESYNLNVLERTEIDKLSDMIEASFATDIKIKQDNIDKWISQFEGAI